jgi:hypothetical protein
MIPFPGDSAKGFIELCAAGMKWDILPKNTKNELERGKSAWIGGMSREGTQGSHKQRR